MISILNVTEKLKSKISSQNREGIIFNGLYTARALLFFAYYGKPKIKFQINKPYFFIDLPDYKNTFWGYYDVTPINPVDNNLLIFHANNANPRKKPDPTIPTSILLYDLNDKTVIKIIGQTYSWNWQQGSRLQWINGKECIYNIYNANYQKFESFIFNIATNSGQTIDYPVQSIVSGRYLISIDYKTLGLIRPDYGYFNKVTNNNDDKLIIYDLIFKKTIAIIDIKQLLPEEFFQTEYGYGGKINHVLPSQKRNEFIFLFRYFSKNNQRKHILLHCQIDPFLISVLVEDCIISHYTWLDSDDILYYGRADGLEDYFEINVRSLKRKNLHTNLSDGHPNPFRENEFISDTYPNNRRIRELFIFNYIKKEKTMIGYFYEPIIFRNETRCDLHPTMHEQFITVDTIFKGYRRIAVTEK